MTTIVLYRDDAGKLRGFQASGHSGYEDKGRDIVCAAVSVLTINTINAIEAFTKDRPQVKSDEDMTKADFPDPPGKEAELLLKTYELGIRSIEQSYGDNVQVEVRRYESC